MLNDNEMEVLVEEILHETLSQPCDCCQAPATSVALFLNDFGRDDEPFALPSCDLCHTAAIFEGRRFFKCTSHSAVA